MITTKMLNEKDRWINLDADLLETQSELLAPYELDDEILEYAIDPNERARIDFDRERDTFVIICNVPNRLKQERHYETVPMTFIVQPHRVISISNEDNAYILQRLYRELELEGTMSRFEFVLSALYSITDEFFPLVEEINREREQLSRVLRDKTTRENLLALSDMETGMVYFVTASKQNAVLLEQLRTMLVFRKMTEDEREQLEDTLIEARQLVDMTQLTSAILNQLSATYNNVLNNSLNDIIKVLTVVSIIMMVPAFFVDFFGMNVPLPLVDNPHAWKLIIMMMIAGCVGIAYLMKYLMSKK